MIRINIPCLLLLSLLNITCASQERHHRQHHGQRVIHVERSAHAVHQDVGNISNPGIWCYTCVSGSMPPMSRALFERSLQIPPEAESDLCDDPFHLQLPTVHVSNAKDTRQSFESIRRVENTSTVERQLVAFVQPCQSSCLKAVLENKHSKIVLRGCLTSIYQQISERDHFFSMPPVGSCDKQEYHSKQTGASITETCLCSSNYCNSASSKGINMFLVLTLLPISLLPNWYLYI